MSMNRFHKMLRSRTFWVFILVFVVNGLEEVRDSIPKEYLPFINALLMGAGIYFRIYPNQQFGASQSKPQSPPLPFQVYPAPPQAPLPAGPAVPPPFSVQPPFFNPGMVLSPQTFAWPQPEPFLPPMPSSPFTQPSFTVSAPIIPTAPATGEPDLAITPESDRNEKGSL